MSGVAMTASKSVQPPLMRLTTSSPPTKSAPASSASRSLSPCAITSTVFDLPIPCGKTSVPRTSWSALRGSTPSQTVNSTVSSNFANAISLTLATPPSRSYLRPSSIFSAAARYFFPCFFITCSEVQAGSLESLPLKTIADFQLPIANSSSSAVSSNRQSKIGNWQLLDRQPHLPRRAFDRADSRFQIRGVQIGKFRFRDLFNLRLRDRSNLLAVRLARARRNARRFLQQVSRRRCLRFKRERAIRKNRDHDRDFQVGIHLRRLRIEGFAELHDVHAVLTERRADRRCRIRFAGRNL